MVIFGGFKQGNRTNEVATYNFATNSWTNVLVPSGDALPCPRSGHSATLHNGNMYIFGGKDNESEKLDDLWVYNIADSKWTQLNPEGDIPYPRSGHSCDIYDDWLVLFGGIWDVTKELNDLWFYSISKNVWLKVIDTANSPQIKSPMKHNTLSNTMQTYTPGIKGSESPSVSPARYENNQTPTRLNKSQTKKFKDSTQGKSGKKRSIATTGQVVRNMNTLA